jgi:class 3 adenylate cyclase
MQSGVESGQGVIVVQGISTVTKGTEEENADGGAREFFETVAAFSLCTDPAEREKLDAGIWERYGTVGFVLITDMSGFSSTTRSLGICYFLGMIHRARQIVAPVVEANNGLLLKCEADNCYSFFDNADDALQACIDLNTTLAQVNSETKSEKKIYLSIGVDYGKLLLVGTNDYFGDPVNTASKLGEDLAGQGETLVTNRALEQAKKVPDVSAEQLVTRISGIDIKYMRLNVGPG